MVWLGISIVPMASVPEATWLRRDSDPGSVKLLGPTRGSRRLRSSAPFRVFLARPRVQRVGERSSFNPDFLDPCPAPPVKPQRTPRVIFQVSGRAQRMIHTPVWGVVHRTDPANRWGVRPGLFQPGRSRPRVLSFPVLVGYPCVREHDTGGPHQPREGQSLLP